MSRSTGLRFVKIRNPHATNEWQGPWSDDSEELKEHPRVKREREVAAGGEGERERGRERQSGEKRALTRDLLFQVLAECGISAVADDGIFLMTVEDVAKYGNGLEGVDCFKTMPAGRKKVAE
jgi:hypothetical protein